MPQLIEAQSDVVSNIPADAALILSALEAGAAHTERRTKPRTPVRSSAGFWLFGTGGTREMTLFSRDVSDAAMGFITRDRLPLGSRGVVELALPGRPPKRVACTVVRCREISADWYEGSLRFSECLN